MKKSISITIVFLFVGAAVLVLINNTGITPLRAQAQTTQETHGKYFENYEGTFYLNVWEDTEIQSMGSTESIYDIPYAPISGWQPINPGDNVKYVVAKVGYTYVILTWDNHFAKIRVKSITSERLIF